MDTKGITCETWVGNIYKKFKNMLLEILEVVIYLVSQMRIVGKSITRFYSDAMKDRLLPRRYYEISNFNQNHDNEATHSTPSSAEVTNLASVKDCCNEIENASVEQTSSVVEFVKSAEEKVMKIVSSSSVILEDPSWEQGDNKTMQQDDDELKLEETCVKVTRDEQQLVSKESINMKTIESARKEEHEELAIYHGNNENRKGDYLECSSLVSESEWELL